MNASGTAFDAALAIVGSATDAAEIYNPATGLWTTVTKMPWKRTGVAASALANGKVLAATGPAPGSLGFPPSSATPRSTRPARIVGNRSGRLREHARPPDGFHPLRRPRHALGGCQGNIATLTLNSLTDVSIYNPTANSWQTGPALLVARTGHSSTIVPGGNVVICGGASGNVLAPSVTTQVDRFDGASWTSIGNMNHERAFHYAGLSQDSQRIYLYGGIESGGTTSVFPTCELFAP